MHAPSLPAARPGVVTSELNAYEQWKPEHSSLSTLPSRFLGRGRAFRPAWYYSFVLFFGSIALGLCFLRWYQVPLLWIGGIALSLVFERVAGSLKWAGVYVFPLLLPVFLLLIARRVL